MNSKERKLPFSINLPAFRIKNKRETAAQPEAHVNPRVRAYGRARIDFAKRIHTQEDWDAMWKPPANFFAFAFPGNEAWRFSLDYRVVEYEAEIGFWIDILGFEVLAIGPEYAQFTPPGGSFAFAVVKAAEGQAPTPPETFRLQFQVEHLLETIQELEMRNVPFEQPALPVAPESTYHLASFRTPNGILVDLCGEVKRVRKEAPNEPLASPAPTPPPTPAAPPPKQPTEPPLTDWKPTRPVQPEKRNPIAEEHAASSSYWSFTPDDEEAPPPTRAVHEEQAAFSTPAVPAAAPAAASAPAVHESHHPSSPSTLQVEEDELNEAGTEEIEFEDEITYESLEEEADDGEAQPPNPSGRPRYFNRS